jgi:hypothetical protein
MWLKNGDLACNTCSLIFNYGEGPRVVVLNAARAKGWHLFKGKSLTGKDLESHLCSDCVGTSRALRAKPQTFEEEVPLF